MILRGGQAEFAYGGFNDRLLCKRAGFWARMGGSDPAHVKVRAADALNSRYEML